MSQANARLEEMGDVAAAEAGVVHQRQLLKDQEAITGAALK